MPTEAEAPDQPPLEKFFVTNRVSYEWNMRINLDAREEGIREY